MKSGRPRPSSPPALGRPLLGRVADRQQLEVVLVVERDRVVGALAGMDAARLDVEAQRAVLLGAPLEVGDADHEVIDAGEHGKCQG